MTSSNSIFRDGVLRDKVAFITGGGSGICLRIAERFAQQGAKVALAGRTQEKLDGALAGIRRAGGDAAGFAADVRDYTAIAAALQKTREQFGEIDILLCGAAGNFPAPALGMSANGFKAVIDIDLLGTFNTCRAAYEHLRKPGASVIAISATHAFRPIPLQSHVCAAKAGVEMLMKNFALEWGPYGIRCNSIIPGFIEDTEGMRRISSESDSENFIRNIPLRRMGLAKEIGQAAAFLSSPLAAYITGTSLWVDGGQALSGSGFFNSNSAAFLANNARP